MSAHCNSFFALSLYLATVSLGAEPQLRRPPQMLPQSAHEKSRNLSALEHLRVATEQLEAAGLAEEAARLREAADQLNRRVIRERAELSRQVTEFQKKSEQLRRLTGRPDKILCRCCLLELSSKSAAEFEAAAEPVSSSTGPRNRTAPAVSFYIREFELDESAKRGAERKMFNEMFRWVKSNAKRRKIKAILCHKLDRICRNMRDAVRLQELEDSCGA